MSDLAMRWGTWLYYECVTFVVHLADVLDITYRDANALIFFVLWPAVTVSMMGWVAWNALVLRRERGRTAPSSR